MDHSDHGDHSDHFHKGCCTITRYQQVLNECEHTPYILLFISHRYIHCISRGVESFIVNSFTSRYLQYLFILYRIESVVNLLIKANTIRNNLLMQQSGRTQFMQGTKHSLLFNRS